jgi:hypothetical protein
VTETKTPWLRAGDGRVRLIVLKMFYFLQKVGGTNSTTGRERKFEVKEHLLDPNNADDAAVLAHPWVHRDFCDGFIESPAATRARVEREAAAEAERTAAAQRRIEILTREADAAFGHAVRHAQQQGAAGAAVADELNTPLNQLGGAALDVPLDAR